MALFVLYFSGCMDDGDKPSSSKKSASTNNSSDRDGDGDPSDPDYNNEENNLLTAFSSEDITKIQQENYELEMWLRYNGQALYDWQDSMSNRPHIGLFLEAYNDLENIYEKLKNNSMY